MQFLIALDLEGIHGVEGERYKSLGGENPWYSVAKENAVKEINVVAKALFDCGATTVAVWDNHGGGGNVDFSKVDKRVTEIDVSKDSYRFEFVKKFDFKAVLFLGYHTMEGTIGGLMAHSFNSVAHQYIKVNGNPVGELYVDTAICSEHGIPAIFIASDDLCVKEMKGIRYDIGSVITKYSHGRNNAEFIDEEKVLSDMYTEVKKSLKLLDREYTFLMPNPSNVEMRFTRSERAEDVFERLTKNGRYFVKYGDDSHVLRFVIEKPWEIMKLF